MNVVLLMIGVNDFVIADAAILFLFSVGGSTHFGLDEGASVGPEECCGQVEEGEGTSFVGGRAD